MIRRALLAFLLSCTRQAPARGQILLYVDTDASTDLFDSLGVEVYEPGATTPCTNCTRVFSLDSDALANRTFSFGIPTAPDTPGYRVRLRMFSSGANLTGEVPDDPGQVVEVVAALPPIAAVGVAERSTTMFVDSIATPRGTLSSPIDTEPGPPARTLVGTWARARAVECAGNAAGQVCVPGSAFWMGNPRVHGDGTMTRADRRRLVVLAPFFVDSTEVTVGRLRSAGDAPEDSWDGASSGGFTNDYCTFAPTGRDALPVNCIRWTHARTFCQQQGGDLPTEAQLEYMASRRQGLLYVWGSDLPDCGDAVFARGGWGTLGLRGDTTCKPPQPPGGAEAVAMAGRDRLELPSGTVFDLAGNLRELARDRWNRQDEPCWSAAKLYVDPLCDQPSVDGSLRTGRGADFFGGTADLAAAVRDNFREDIGYVNAGFRCVRPAK